MTPRLRSPAFLALSALAPAFAASCAPRHATVAATPRGSIRGRVASPPGAAPATGLDVRLCHDGVNRTATTGSNGAFRFDDVSPGNSFVFVTDASLGVDVKSVSITASAPATIELQPQPAGTVTGRVVDDNGNAIAGANVQLLPRFPRDAGMTHPEETAIGRIPEEAVPCLRSVATRLTTDKDGRFTATNVVGEQGVRIVVDAPSWFDLGTDEGGPRTALPGTAELEIGLTRHGRVDGVVHGRETGFVVADRKGFRKLVALRAGHFSVELEPNDFDLYFIETDAKRRNDSPPRPYPHHGPAAHVTVKSGARTTLELDPEK